MEAMMTLGGAILLAAAKSRPGCGMAKSTTCSLLREGVCYYPA